MKKTAFFSFILVLSLHAFGQSLNSNQFAAPGDVLNYYLTDTLGILPGASGTSQIWNFEDLNVDTVLQTDVYLPPVITNPPVTGHTTAIGDSLQGYTFFKNTSTEFAMLGFSDSANVTVVAYSNPMTIVTFPFSYANTSADNFAFTTTFQGYSVNASGTCNTIADGTGNLLLPQGAFNNVLRVKSTIISNFSVLIYNVTQTQEIYEWFDGAGKFPLLHIENIVTTDPFGGLPTVDKRIWIAATGPAGISANVTTNDFSLLPNPVLDQVNIQFNDYAKQPTGLVITNALGQVVYQNLTIDHSQNSLSIATQHFERGLYFVTLIQKDKSITKKMVKH